MPRAVLWIILALLGGLATCGRALASWTSSRSRKAAWCRGRSCGSCNRRKAAWFARAVWWARVNGCSAGQVLARMDMRASGRRRATAVEA